VNITSIEAWTQIDFGMHPLYFGEYLYVNDELVTEIVIPDTVTSIAPDAFTRCTNLISIIIPDSVTSIAGGAFNSCSGLISISIPDSITKLENNVFAGCTNLTSVTIPDSVTDIEAGAFYACSSLVDIYFEGTIEQWNDIRLDERNLWYRDWDGYTGEYTIHCTDGDISKE
jgi:hypothetical protein